MSPPPLYCSLGSSPLLYGVPPPPSRPPPSMMTRAPDGRLCTDSGSVWGSAFTTLSPPSPLLAGRVNLVVTNWHDDITHLCTTLVIPCPVQRSYMRARVCVCCVVVVLSFLCSAAHRSRQTRLGRRGPMFSSLGGLFFFFFFLQPGRSLALVSRRLV